MNSKSSRLTVYNCEITTGNILVVIDPFFNYYVVFATDPGGLGWGTEAGITIAGSNPPNWVNVIEVSCVDDYQGSFDKFIELNYPEFSRGESPDYDLPTYTYQVIDMIVNHAMKIWDLEHQPINYVDRTQSIQKLEQPSILSDNYPLQVVDFRPKNAFVWVNGKITMGKIISPRKITNSRRTYYELDENSNSTSFSNAVPNIIQSDVFPIIEGQLKIYQDVRVMKLENTKYVVKLPYEVSMQSIVNSSQVEIISTFENWYLDNLQEKDKVSYSQSQKDWPVDQKSTEYMFNIGHYVPNYLLIDYKLTERTASKFGFGLIVCRVTNETRNPAWLTKSRLYALNNIVIIPDWLAFARNDYMPVNPVLVCDEVVSYLKQYIHPLDFFWILDPQKNQYFWYKHKQDYLRNDNSPLGLTVHKYDSPLGIGENDSFCVLPLVYNADAVSVAGMTAYAAMRTRPSNEYKKDFTKGANYYV